MVAKILKHGEQLLICFNTAGFTFCSVSSLPSQALSILLLPHNIPSSLNLLTSMVDDMWHYAGDQSTDVSLYTV